MNTDAWYYGDLSDTTDDRPNWHHIKYIDWVENDLKAAKERGVEHIFTFSHENAISYWSHLRDGFQILEETSKVKLIQPSMVFRQTR